MKADFRKPPQAAPKPAPTTPKAEPPAVKPNLKPNVVKADDGFGKIMQSGQVVSRPLTALEKEELAKAGVSTDEPIPSNTAEILEKAAQQAYEEAWSGPPRVPDDYVKPEMKLVEYDKASPGQRRSFQAGVKQMLDAARQVAAKEKSDAKIHYAPGVQEALDALQEEEENLLHKTQEPETADVGDDLSGTGRLDSGDDGSGLAVDAICPKCGWNQKNPKPIQPTEKDSRDFEDALLGFTADFRKSYRLLHGKAEATFRTLSVMETDLTAQLAQREYRDGKILTLDGMAARVSRVRLALQLVSFTSPKAQYWAAESFSAWPVEGVDDVEKLAKVFDLVNETIFKNESLLRALWTIYDKFNALVILMESRVLDENFDDATGSGT